MKHELYMKKCLTLAKKSEGKTSPNPMVGCIVLDKDEKIIATGYHKKYGDYHAERNALLKVTREEALGGTLVVNLEPCSHVGKTPPCTDIIIEKGIKKVVIGMLDPNPKVDGIQKLKNAGIEVLTGVLEQECKKLNEIFIVNQKEHRTFVALKVASTIDGKVSTCRGDSKWITSEKSRQKAKKLRQKYDAILTSSSTVILDNPRMKHKKKIILDRTLKTDFKNAEIYKSGEIIVFHSSDIVPSGIPDSIKFIRTPENDGKLNIQFILKKLYENGIMSIFVEAGGKLLGEFLPYSDKVYHYIAPKILGDNKGRSCYDGRNINKISDCIDCKIEEMKKSGNDILMVYKKIGT